MSKKAIVDFIPVQGSAYVGPGDVVASATGWWGFRAYSAAKCGSNCVDIIRASDSTTNTFTTLASGNLDTASIATFLTSTTGKISKLYDQAGTNNLEQATSGSQPAYTASVIGSLSGMTFAGGQNLTSHSALGQNAPFTAYGAAKRSSGTAYGDILGSTDGGGVPQIGFSNSSQKLFLYTGTLTTLTGNYTENIFHSYQWVSKTAGTKTYTDGTTTTTGDSGVSIWSSNKIVMGSGNNSLTGVILEGGIWGTDNSANFASMESNIRTYWGF